MPDSLGLTKITGVLEGVHIEEILPGCSFLEMAGVFADMPGTVVLASGGDSDCAKHHIMAVRPWLSLKAWPGLTEIEACGRNILNRGNPLETLRAVLNCYSISPSDEFGPIAAGLFGYLAYDLKDCIEELPRTTMDDTGLPIASLYAPSLVLVSDLSENKTRLCIPFWRDTGDGGVRKIRRWFLDCLSQAKKHVQGFSGSGSGFSSPFTRITYMEAVEKIREYVAAGHVYQVNLSQRFETGFSGRPYAMFSELFSRAPASFYAYLNAGDHWIVSTSPERFMMRQSDFVETRPIKGTRPRGENKESDLLMAEELKNSPKDDAELSMIVDLMRNDLGRICAAGTVAVAEHRRLEAYENVFHLVSVVQGRLARGRDSVDLLRAAFPGGSITGCPKIRAMEIIDELEPRSRHVYTGSIGYISFHETLDLSIAIRTALIFNGRMLFSVGGGVVFDSDPEEEYEETLHKGRSVMSVFKSRAAGPEKRGTIWLNGMLMPESEARVPVSSPGFQYGHGFFETIRADHGRPGMMKKHIERFSRTWQALFDVKEPELTWDEIIRQVIAANDLTRKVCAVKLLAAAASADGAGMPNIAVTAAPYVHRLEQANKPALDLKFYPHPRQTPLASHKTLNYLYYFLAGKWARAKGADEAVILNPDGTVSETNTANLLLLQGDTVILPESPHVLAGVMEAAVLERLLSAGFSQKRMRVTPEDLFGVDMVIAANSLMGPVGVRSVDGIEISCDPEWITRIRSDVLA